MERITIGIDHEAPSQRAVDWVIRRAREKPVAIRLVTALDVLMSYSFDGEVLDRVKRRIEKAVPGVEVTTALIDGSITEVLVGQSQFSDLLVLGYHRTRPIRSLLAGALPARVAARSFCTTVIVPEDWRARKGSVVLGVGDDDTATTAIEFAVREATHPRRILEVVHAWRLPAPSWDTIGSLVASAEKILAEHRKTLDERVRSIRKAHPALTVREDFVEAAPARAILDRAGKAELIVIGTHRRGPVTGTLLGSTAMDLLPEARVPVCIVPLVAPLTPAGGILATVPGT